MHRVRRLFYPCWVLKTASDEHGVYLSLQVDEKATDTYAGGEFRLELEKSAGPRPASGLSGRAMFFQLLTRQELAGVLAQQNNVIRTLPRPPAAQVEAYPSSLRPTYLSWFDSQQGFDAIKSWMRYRTSSDVDAWAGTLRPLIGVTVDRGVRYLRRGTVHLGRGSLVEDRS
jgi:hypothetical protein